MKIRNIKINNFKSIENVTIPLQSYGTGKNKSNSAFLVGVNESGKSAILDAIGLLSKGMDEVDYEENCFLEAQEENDYIDIYARIELTNLEFWKKQISEKLNLDESFVKNLKISNLEKNVYLNNESNGSYYFLTINDDLPYYEYVVITSKVVAEGKEVKTEEIHKLSEINKIEEEVTKENAKSFLRENQKILTKKDLQTKIAAKLKRTFEHNLPKIQVWKPSSEFLINDTISLDDFKEDTSISIPLKNIFNVFGLDSDEDIKLSIERALKNQARCDELQNKMSSIITKHINKIWKEHKIKIRISINGTDCQVHIEDKDKAFAYYKMNQRSDGFKQFVSLILSLSAQNASNNLKNKIILIDEPEVHLHPSGVRYMRDEILKIGKNNSVLVATHSHYMVDTDCPERHWIVSKKEIKTGIYQINEDTPIEDDVVLASAFGLNLFKELLPKHIIIVEGADDKSIMSHAINKLNNKFFHSIKTAKGASKAYSIASLFAEENISAFFLFDDDNEGKQFKNKIIQNFSDSFNESNVFTLRDILGTLPLRCTLEDVIPLSFVKEFFEKELKDSLSLNNDTPVLKQIKDQKKELRDNKQKLDSLKVKLSLDFIKTFNTKVKIETEAKTLVALIKEFTKRIGV